MTFGVVLVTMTVGRVLVRPARDADVHNGAPPVPAPWNVADRSYVQAMLWHQDQAKEMAQLVQGRATRPELRRLARSMRAADSRAVAELRAWLRAHGGAVSLDDAGQPPTEQRSRWFAGMMAAPQLQMLASTTGQRFDFLFVDMLVEHHKGAVVMADGVLVDGRNAAVASIAHRSTIYAQRAIRQLTGWRRRWAEPFIRQLTSPAVRSMPASR